MNYELSPQENEELRREEMRILEEFSDRYSARPYRRIFYVPSGDSRIEGLFENSFYRSARTLLQAVLDGKLQPAEGIAAVFLCRHYLELALKFALFHSRWLSSENRNTSNEEIEAVKHGHNLEGLWQKLKRELSTRVPSILKTGLDLDFVGQMVKEFNHIDRDNWRFRYPVEEIAVNSRPASVSLPVGIDFEALLADLEHAHGVLEGLDSYLIETHGANEEWESILDSI